MAKKKPEKKENFESLCRRLEQIVQSLEDETLSLEESIELFSEGVDLASRARALLDEGEKTVRKLIRKIDGGFALEDLES
ncbi:MAG: exodeoxyribonuclease VII small subunit [Gemmatimonadota bacterium]|nr:exodeoxyribonuclease VII small subunit [Gemmatimonadota bacterium]